jgi:hypothetical protein
MVSELPDFRAQIAFARPKTLMHIMDVALSSSTSSSR